MLFFKFYLKSSVTESKLKKSRCGLRQCCDGGRLLWFVCELRTRTSPSRSLLWLQENEWSSMGLALRKLNLKYGDFLFQRQIYWYLCFILLLIYFNIYFVKTDALIFHQGFFLLIWFVIFRFSVLFLLFCCCCRCVSVVWVRQWFQVSDEIELELITAPLHHTTLLSYFQRPGPWRS